VGEVEGAAFGVDVGSVVRYGPHSQIHNPQSPIPNPQSPIKHKFYLKIYKFNLEKFLIKK